MVRACATIDLDVGQAFLPAAGNPAGLHNGGRNHAQL
jgi:hypothetical protein